MAIMDDDDIMHPLRIEKQVREFLNDTTVGVVSVSMFYANEKGEFYGKFAVPPESHEWFKVKLLFGNVIGNPNVMLNKRALGIAGFYDYVFSPDWYLWLRLLFEGG